MGRSIIRIMLIALLAGAQGALQAAPVARRLPDPYYPQKPEGELRLNYYYDRSGQWVKFSEWIPYQQKKFRYRFLEDYYRAFGLPIGYNVPEIKENIYFLHTGLGARFRHPRNALTEIKTEAEYHKYRLLMHMHIHHEIDG